MSDDERFELILDDELDIDDIDIEFDDNEDDGNSRQRELFHQRFGKPLSLKRRYDDDHNNINSYSNNRRRLDHSTGTKTLLVVRGINDNGEGPFYDENTME